MTKSIVSRFDRLWNYFVRPRRKTVWENAHLVAYKQFPVEGRDKYDWHVNVYTYNDDVFSIILTEYLSFVKRYTGDHFTTVRIQLQGVDGYDQYFENLSVFADSDFADVHPLYCWGNWTNHLKKLVQIIEQESSTYTDSAFIESYLG